MCTTQDNIKMALRDRVGHRINITVDLSSLHLRNPTSCASYEFLSA